MGFEWISWAMWLLHPSVSARTERRPRIRASDVVFMYVPEPRYYDAYMGTVVGWGGRPPSRNPGQVETFRRRVEEAHRRGLRYCASVDFLVDFRGFIDFRPETFMDAVCRDLDGNPLRVPWLWDHTYKGIPAYWWCTNHPDYRAYLRNQVERACTAPIDGLHIDDYSGTSACSAYNGGCFCRYCMEGFRAYLRQRFTPEERRALGIEDVEKFDYAAFLRAKGITAEEFRRHRARCPLGEVFQDFQNERMLELVRETFEYAERLRGRPLLRSVNSSASSPRSLLPTPVLDYFCGEVNHRAGRGEVSLEPLFVYRLVEGLGKRQTATAAGHDWAWINAHNKPGLVRAWIAQAYAFGNVFMAPHRQWCYTRERGTHWWRPEPEWFAGIYRFVRRHAALLDDYVSLARVALVYSNANFRSIREAALTLAEANVPFTMLVAGDEDLPYRLQTEDLEAYDVLIVGPEPLTGEQERQVKEASARKVVWEGRESLPEEVREEVRVEGSRRVRVSLRHRPNDPRAPLVCHLLNQDYEVERDAVRSADVRVALSLRLVQRVADPSTFRRATIYTLDREPATVPLRREGEYLIWEVSTLGLWAIVALERET